MDFSTDINDNKLRLFFWQDGHKVSDFVFSLEEAKLLNIKLMQEITYLEYEKAKNVTPYGRAPLITGIEHTDTGIVVHCKKRD